MQYNKQQEFDNQDDMSATAALILMQTKKSLIL